MTSNNDHESRRVTERVLALRRSRGVRSQDVGAPGQALLDGMRWQHRSAGHAVRDRSYGVRRRGAGASGNAAFSANDQVVTLTAGGFCGSIQPAPGVFNPFNQNGGQLLALVYP